MIKASDVQLTDEDAWGDFLVPIATAALNPPEPEASAEFPVNVPRAGAYFISARWRCPSGLPEGFALDQPSGRMPR